MKKYFVNYRGEFSIDIEAESPEQAIYKIDCGLYDGDWEQTGELHHDFLEIVDEDEL